jgi:hypothetical protein
MQFEELVDVAKNYLSANTNKGDFLSLLNEFIFRSNKKAYEIYKKAYMDRRTYSNLTRKKYNPSKKAVISIGMALELDYHKMKKFVESAGFSLSNYFTFDLVIMCCIEHKIYNLDIVNALLVELGEKPLNNME